MKKNGKIKLCVSLFLVAILLVVIAVTLTSCSGPIEGLNKDSIINQIFPNIWVLIGQLISMVVIFSVIMFFIWKPANKMLENRRALILAEIEEGKKLQEEANEKLAYVEAMEANSKAEANERASLIIADAQEQARIQKEKIIIDANNQAQRDVRKLKNDAEIEIINTAFKTAEYLMKKEVSKKDNEKLVKEFISNL